MEELSFESYCRKKKIDPDLFLNADPEKFKEWETIFMQVHPDSFTEQKKFLINPIRKLYTLKENPVDKPIASAAIAKPVIKVLPFKKS